MDTKVVIIKAIQKATGEADIHLEIPELMEHGDYATNVALILAKKKKITPMDLANEIKIKLSKDKDLSKYVSKIEVAGPGFINFWLSEKYLISELGDVLKKKSKFGSTNVLKGKKYLLEHTSPDPIKTIHIGHLRNNFLGMTMSNVMKFEGAKVVLDCINNDRGTHVNRAMFGYLVFGKKDQELKGSVEYMKDVKGYDLTDDEVKRLASGKKWEELVLEWSKKRNGWYTPDEFSIGPDKFDNAFYSLGQRSSELVDGVDDQIQDMLKAWEDEHPELRKLWRQIIDWSLEGYAKTYDRIGSRHDKVWHESEHYDKGKKWVEKGLKKGVFMKLDDGAVLSDLSDYGMTDTIVQKKDGTGVYHTQDLHLTYQKVTKYPSDLYIWDIGSEQKLYMKQLFAMCEQLGIAKRENLMHLNYGFLTLKGGTKMSSRYGSVINADDLLDTLHQRARKIIEDSDPKLRGEMSEEEREKLSEEVALAAAKYGFLKYARERDAVFDMDESLALQGNSGPYLQYTYARTQSVIKKAGGGVVTDKSFTVVKMNKEELVLLRTFSQFPDVLVGVVKNYSPNLLCNYLFDLAQKYNNFYNQHKIIGSNNEDFRLAITFATGQILSNGLKLLGIKAPDRM